MKLILRFLSISWALASFMVHAQNLVPNPGFEEGDVDYSSYRSIIGTTYWEIPQIGAEDIYKNYQISNSYLAGTFDCKVQKGVFHHANAFPTTMYNKEMTGDALANLCISPFTEAYEGSKSLCIYWWLKFCPEKRSYATVRLSEPLEKGKHYFISFKMTSGYSYQDRWITNGLGIYFSNHRLVQPVKFGRIDAQPQIELNEIFYQTQWTEIALKFTADSNYQFFHIGNFRKTEDLKIDSVKKDTNSKIRIYYPLGYNGAYSFIDDVHIEPYDPDQHLIKVTEFAKNHASTKNNDQLVLDGMDTLVIDKQGSIGIHEKRITVSVEDYSERDGDIISLYFNGKLVLKKYTLEKKPKKIVLTLPDDIDVSELVMKAHNLGTIPPNTALLKVWDGKEVHSIRISSILEKSGSIELRRLQ
jgi:hypothetical protein